MQESAVISGKAPVLFCCQKQRAVDGDKFFYFNRNYQR